MNVNEGSIGIPYPYITKKSLEEIISEIPMFISMVPSGKESFFQSTVNPMVIISVMKSYPYGHGVETVTVTLTSSIGIGINSHHIRCDFKIIPQIHSLLEITCGDNSPDKYKMLMEGLLVSWSKAFVTPEVYQLKTFNKDVIKGYDQDLEIGFETNENNKGYLLTLCRGEELLYLSEINMTYGNIDCIFNHDISNLLSTIVLVNKEPIGCYLLPSQQTPGLFDHKQVSLNKEFSL